ncbi:MAG TPA: amidohydrolase family protein [Sphingobium sp.]
MVLLKRLLALMACLSTGAAALPDSPPGLTAGGEKGLLLDNVTIVDTRNGRLETSRSVVIRGNQILAVTASGKTDAVEDLRRIDAHGAYLVPGYLDMHAHVLESTNPDADRRLMLSYGVTGFRQMAGSPAWLKQRREGTLLAGNLPRLLAMPGTVLTGGAVPDPDRARAAVGQQHDEGADFIKAIDMPPPAYLAALDEAARLHMPFAGHLPPSIDLRDAVLHGMKSVEHLGPDVSILVSCSRNEAAIRAELRAIPPGGSKIPPNPPREVLKRLVANPVLLTPDPLYALFGQVLDTYDEAKCRDLAKMLSMAETWQVPTLIREQSMRFGNAPHFRNAPELRYIPERTRKMWSEVGADFGTKLSPSQKATMARMFQRELALVKLFDAAGVKMLAGSDMGGGWLIPGMSLHQEFDLLAKAGLSPLRILQMTTLDGARFLGLEAEMGTIEPGKRADIVLLDANPLKDVRNLHRVAGVVMDGQYMSRKELNALQDKVAADASLQK